MRRQVDVTAVGEILIDFLAPDASDLAAATTFVKAPGGAPANVAVAAARLGAGTAFVGAVGDDPFGAELLQTLKREGVRAVTQVVPARTTLAFVARNAGGIPNFVFFHGADRALRPHHVPPDLLAGSGFVHVSSMALLGEPSRGATLLAAERAAPLGAVLSVDPNLRPGSWPDLATARAELAPLLRLARVLKVNDEEARLLTGVRDLNTAMDLLTIPDRLLLVTLGEDGAVWRWSGREGRVPGVPVTVADTTGAGDAFVGALLAELAACGYSGPGFDALTPQIVDKVVRFAVAGAAVACTRPGAMAALPDREAVHEVLRYS